MIKIDKKMYAVIRSGSGLGDAIYNNSVIQYLLNRYENISLRTKYPGVYRYLPIKTESFKKGGEDLAYNYGGTARKRQETNVYQDLLLAAGLDKNLEFKTKWEWCESELCDNVIKQADSRKIFLFSSPHQFFGRDDGRGDRMIPNWNKFNCLLDEVKRRNYFIVQVGSGKLMYTFNQIDLDLKSKTTIADLMNLGMIAAGGLGQCGFIIPLMEGFYKPCFIILAKKGLDYKEDWFIANVTPQKILSRLGDTSDAGIDNEDDNMILEKFKKILEKIK